MALQSDGTLAAAHSERQAAEADHSAALRQRWPALDLNGNYTQLEHAPNLSYHDARRTIAGADLGA